MRVRRGLNSFGLGSNYTKSDETRQALEFEGLMNELIELKAMRTRAQ